MKIKTINVINIYKIFVHEIRFLNKRRTIIHEIKKIEYSVNSNSNISINEHRIRLC